MNRIPAVDPTAATGIVESMLDGVHKGPGVTPNLFRVAAQSTSVREGLTSRFGAISKGRRNAKTREAIALTNSLNEVAKTEIDFPVVTHHPRCARRGARGMASGTGRGIGWLRRRSMSKARPRRSRRW